jgi:hypothetical protein
MARCLELGERRWAGIVTMSANKLGLEATLRPVGRPRKRTVPVVRPQHSSVEDPEMANDGPA